LGTLYGIYGLLPLPLSLSLCIQIEKELSNQHIRAAVILQARVFALLDKSHTVYHFITVINTRVQLIRHEDLQGSGWGL